MNPILWQPSNERIEKANISKFMSVLNDSHGLSLNDYRSLYRWSIDNPEAFWSLLWDFSEVIAEKKGRIILKDGDKMPGAKWFPEARLNYSENLLRERNKSDLAINFWDEGGIERSLSYNDLYSQTSQLSRALRDDGLIPGDRVAAVLPNLPETVIAMLATSSIGAIWTSCSPDFGIQSIVDRFGQVQPKILFICDGYYHNGQIFDISDRIEKIIDAIPSIEKTIVIPYILSRTLPKRADLMLWDETVSKHRSDKPIKFEQLPFDHPLFILFSSGTTGPPKCIVHGVGGTLLQHLKEHLLHVDIHPNDRVFYFTTCGWMMWNWLISSLASRASLVLYDGSPVHPSSTILFNLIDEAKINVFGVSAKYIDQIKKSGLVPRASHDLSSLKTILSTGSPLVEEGFDFVYRSIKTNVCLSSISGGTDIISCFVLGCPILPVRRGEIQCRGLGMDVKVFDDYGSSIQGQKGELVCTSPFPSMPVCFWNDPDQNRYRSSYFEKFPSVWCHGDYVELTENVGMIVYGRSDAILNPGGIRIGTAEIYRQVEQIDEVIESLAIGQDWQNDCRIILFILLRDGLVLSETLVEKIKQQIKTNASPRHVPAKIIQVNDIPRTKSGKIVELAVREIVHGRKVLNKGSLANPEALKQFTGLDELRI